MGSTVTQSRTTALSQIRNLDADDTATLHNPSLSAHSVPGFRVCNDTDPRRHPRDPLIHNIYVYRELCTLALHAGASKVGRDVRTQPDIYVPNKDEPNRVALESFKISARGHVCSCRSLVFL
jgi:hypothetical protein